MAQAPKQGIPPAPPHDPNAGLNIHGQGPKPNMAPPEEAPSGVADNTKAEMEAGKKNLQQHDKRDNAEHEAGQKVLQQHASKK